MSEVLVLDNLSLLPQGPTLSLTLASGQSACILGPAASGKSRLLRCIAGQIPPAQGSLSPLAHVVFAEGGALSRRTTPHSLAWRAGRGSKGTISSEALSATRLWADRQTPVANLSPTQVAACELLPILAGDPDLILIDGQLDCLDPWTLSGVLDVLRSKMREGASLVASTNRPDLVPLFDFAIVLKDAQPVFAGRLSDLLHQAPDSELEVETDVQGGVRALVDPFTINVVQKKGQIHLRAREGQQTAARLLTEGYGDIKMVVLREPSVEEALLNMM